LKKKLKGTRNALDEEGFCKVSVLKVCSKMEKRIRQRPEGSEKLQSI
jgi:hypothetical protein